MGSFVSADCSCGHHGFGCVGAGFETFMTECSFPCHCPSCSKVVSADLLAAQPSCPDCGSTAIVSYEDPSMIGVAGDEIVASWAPPMDRSRTFSLTDGTYFCPACGKKELRFTDAGCFD